MEMRSLPIFANARGQFTIAQPVRLPNRAWIGKEGHRSLEHRVCGEFKGAGREDSFQNIEKGPNPRDAPKSIFRMKR